MIENLMFSANVILPIFFLIVIGYVLSRLELWNEYFLKIANDLAFKCFLPVLLFYNVATANIFEVIDVPLIAFACISVCLLCACLFILVPIFVKDKKRIGVIIQGTFRSNFLLFGVPLGLSIGGESGAVLAAVLAAFYVPVINMLSTIALYVYSDAEDKSIKSALIGIISNPLIIGGIAGLIFSIVRNSLNLELPVFIDSTLIQIKGIATPFAFMILGGDLKLTNLLNNIKLSLFAVVGKIIIIPAIMLSICISIGFNPLQMGILLAVYATPNAVSSYAMARNYEADYDLAGEIVTLSTVLSIITMFIFITICKSMGVI